MWSARARRSIWPQPWSWSSPPTTASSRPPTAARAWRASTRSGRPGSRDADNGARRMAIDRRGAVLAGLGFWAGGAMTARAAADPLSGRALYADVKTYARFGDHRTGTDGDDATATWLEPMLWAAGYTVERQAFDYPMFEPARAELAVGGRTIAGFPYWTPCTTPPGGVTAALSAS